MRASATGYRMVSLLSHVGGKDGRRIGLASTVEPGVGGAVWGPSGISGDYRYNLWRHLGPELQSVLFVMLNPSTATHQDNDATIRRCIGFAKAWGFGCLEVANIFAIRSTDPAKIYRAEDPIGPDNDAEILEASERCEMTVCAWGTHGAFMDRGRTVTKALLSIRNADVRALKINADGSPAHPLYLSAKLVPVSFGASV